MRISFVRKVCHLQIVAALALGSLAVGEEQDNKHADRATPQSAIKGFLRALGNADLETMRTYYAPRVTVLRGSTLLQQGFGISEAGDTGKNVTVDQELLLKAYAKAAERYGWKKERVRRGKRFARFDIEYLDKKSENADKIFKAIGAKPDDVVAVVNPKGDELAFVLRSTEKSGWLIVSEFWD